MARGVVGGRCRGRVDGGGGGAEEAVTEEGTKPVP